MRKQRPQTVFIIYYDLNIGGVQRKIVDIANFLNTLSDYRDSKIHLLLATRQKNILASQIKNPNVIVHYKPFFRYPFWVFIFFHILIYRPKTILTFLPVPAFQTFMALRLHFWNKIRFVISEDVITSHAFNRNDFTGTINNKLAAVFLRADAILVPSTPIATDLTTRYRVPKEHIVLASNWVIAPRHLRPLTQSVDCVYMGRFDKEKRIPLLLSAVAQIRRTIPDILLRLVGEGRESQLINKTIKRLGIARRVVISKPTRDIWGPLLQAKLAVLASDSEGVPMFLLEAMAAGLPVVSMYFPGAEQIVIQNRSGIVCRNKSEFIAAISELRSNAGIRRSMGLFAQRIIRKQYAPSNMNTYIHHLFLTQ